jgi:hypothetical protein
MSDRLTLAAKARALIDESDLRAVRAGLREIAEALEASSKLPRTTMDDLCEAASRPFVDALRDKLLLEATNHNDFSTILPAAKEMLCCCIVEGWLSPTEVAAEPKYAPDRTIIARDIGNDLPDMVERFAQEYGRTGCLLMLEPDARGLVILRRQFPEFYDDDGDTIDA